MTSLLVSQTDVPQLLLSERKQCAASALPLPEKPQQAQPFKPAAADSGFLTIQQFPTIQR